MKPAIITSLLLLTVSLTLLGCSTSDSPTAPAPQIDTAPPSVPTGLTAAASRPTALISSAELNWRDNTADSDFQGFMVYRLAFGQSWPLTETPLQTTRFVDLTPFQGGTTYAVTAVDLSGNESAWTTVRYGYPIEYPDVTSQ